MAEEAAPVGESRPLRKHVRDIGGGIVGAKEFGVAAVVRKNVFAKPKPYGDRKIEFSAREKERQGLVSKFEEASSDMMMTVNGESKISEGGESGLLSKDCVKRDNIMASEIYKVTAEETSPDTKDPNLFKKSFTLSKEKPSLLRLPSLISPGSSVGRTVDGQKSVEGRQSIDKTKVLERKKCLDGRKVVQGRESLDGRKRPCESIIVDPDFTQTADGNASNTENNEGGVKNLLGSKKSPAKKRLVKSNSLNLETSIKDIGLGNGKNIVKSEMLKKQVPAPKPKLLSMRPSDALDTVAVAVKPSSLLHPSSGSRIKTSDDSQVGKKNNASKLDTKKLCIPTIVTPSSGTINGEDSADTKKVRVARVSSLLRRPSKITKVAANDLNDQGIQKDIMDVIKQAPEKKSLASTKTKMTSSNGLLSPAQLVTKSTVRTRISSLPSPNKKSFGESEQNTAGKDASLSGVQKTKAVELKSENQRPSKLQVRSNTTVAETTPRRSYLKKDGPAGGAHKNSSDKFHPGRPSFRRKKTTQVLSNQVIEETTKRLIRIRKSKVMALVGAFETVISIQKKSARALKTKKRLSSSKISR